jgi:succinoglycan biosynthesis protein ExoA
MSESTKPNLSIVVACRNEIRHMAEFLDSILAQDLQGMDWEVIVADGMSTDGTRQMLDEYCAAHPGVLVIANPGRIVSTGLNLAIRAAKGDIIVRMDAHTFYAPDYTRRCIETLKSSGADNVGGPARTKTSGILHRTIAAAYHSRFSTGGARFHDESYEGLVDTVTYGCWRKETLERIGMFDEALVRNQDDELNLRLTRGGGKIWQNPAIVSWYSPRTSLAGLFRQYFQYGFWKVAVIRKHRIPGSWRHMVPVAFVLGNAFLLAGTILAALLKDAPRLIWFESLLLLATSLYLSAALVASFFASKQDRVILPLLPAAFATYHVSYGVGFLMGMMRFFSNRAPAVQGESSFTRISR